MVSTIERNRYSNQTATVPRPSRATHPDTLPVVLEALGREWDDAERDRRVKERIAADQAPLLAARDAERAAVAKQHADAQAERDAVKDAAIDQTLRAGYFRDPGATEEGFRAALPDLREARRRRLAIDGDPSDHAARQAMRRLVTT